jgi:hypothetical protein
LPQTSASSFRPRIEHEFIVGSAIDPTLFAATVRLVADTQQFPGGDIETPIHDALNWRYTRFGFQAVQTLHAALLLNEDASCWQAKLSQPRCDRKGKLQKYETPIGNGSRAFLPHIPAIVRQRIGDRYGLKVPLIGSFWDWLQQHPEIPIVFTEGGKKALALLSLGYVAIALVGVNGGYVRCSVTGNRSLIPAVARFAVAGRQTLLAFDQDAEVKTRSRVNLALLRFGGLLKQAGCNVAIASWNGQQGKGADDLIVNCGTAAIDRSIVEALPLEHWQIWQQLEHRLTYAASISVNTADLSTLNVDRIPERGIIGISSRKGTGKTKLTNKIVKTIKKVLAGGHRVALMRNLCERLKFDYRGDLDKVKGQFISDSGYALRIGFCVDSLLAIDPATFADCDLLLDEIVQIVRHILTSETCAKDGKRPALLARLHALIRSARRVIVADADLDNATLHYLQTLRGDDAPVFLIRNDYQAQGYPVCFIEATERSVIISRLLNDAASLEPGKMLFVSTDSIGTTIAQFLAKHLPQLRVLLINSKTSGGVTEREFIATPDAVLARGEWDVIIASPTLATGVSIEIQGAIAKVYGIFQGASSTDADMAQALGRVREPVERVVWCAKRGSNFSKVSRSTNPIEFKSHLQQRTNAIASLIRSSLQEDMLGVATAIDWQADLHLNLYARIMAEQNRSMLNLRDCLRVRLQFEGNPITIEKQESDPAARFLLRDAANQVKLQEAEAKANATDLTYGEVALLEAKEDATPDEQLAIAKFHLKEFYCLEEVTTEDVLADRNGRRRGELLGLEAQLYPNIAIDRTVRALEKQARWNQGLCPWDISGAELRRALREKLGLNNFLDPDREWTRDDLTFVASQARQFSLHIKAVLHFTVKPEMSDVQIVHQLLSQVGIKVVFRWSRSIAGHEGKKLRVYRLDADWWQEAIGILEQRKARREKLAAQAADAAEAGSPLRLITQKQTGDPDRPTAENTQNIDSWLSPESLVDVRTWLEAAEADPNDKSIAELLNGVPPEALKRAKAS